MLAHHFATNDLPKAQQLEAWRAWYDTIFDVAPRQAGNDDFVAANSTWTVSGLTLSRVASPANTVSRTKSVIRHNAVDHWVITLSKDSVSDVTTRGVSFEAAPKTPFIVSFGEEIGITRRQEDNRLQLLLPRDNFQAIAPVIDAARAMPLTSPTGRMLADYILLLEQNVPSLEDDAANRLSNAVQAMLLACLAPTGARQEAAREQIRLTLMERVRQGVRRNILSPSLGPDKLCREAATSRSQLYRLLEDEGGVARYIQRRRLSESFAMLCDTRSSLAIGAIAEMLCFADASSFTRAFRREFGMAPSDVRAATQAGLAPAPPIKALLGPGARTFSDCLRAA
ncbi:MAG: helix-turn-helix domain-containing protein [Reyranella sp.]|jgi:AraC-like DNA-binding protein|nr:helix-turn-helix domain-containing protein [Reyranella sp.]